MNIFNEVIKKVCILIETEKEQALYIKADEKHLLMMVQILKGLNDGILDVIQIEPVVIVSKD